MFSYLTGEDLYQMLQELTHSKLPYRSIKKDYDMAKNVNSEICSECKGKCCKWTGCHFSPDDFKEISFDFLKKEIEKGYISIVYIEMETTSQDSGVYILRTRNQGAPIVDIGFTGLEDTPCILLTDKGCKLDYEHRPTGGKLLIPSKDRQCNLMYTAKDCCYEWEPHQKVLQLLMEHFVGKEIPCSL